MSLDRLIDLAQKTGDRLIVHDRYSERDLVILDIDSYEQLIEGKKDVRQMTEGQMLDQINRDIAIWRASQHLEQDFADVPAPWETDVDEEWEKEESPWHRAGGVMEDRYSDWAMPDEKPEAKMQIPDWPDWNEPKKDWRGNDDTMPQMEDALPNPIPRSFQVLEDNHGGISEAEALPDEPVFYEEPV